jgi:heme-degrading monooxygenase HmoA
MFAHYVALKLKPNAERELTRLLQNRLLPLLRERDGFCDEITLTSDGGTEVLVISLWDTRQSAEAYDRIRYVDFLRAVASLLEGIPKVELLQVTDSTLRRTNARVA